MKEQNAIGTRDYHETRHLARKMQMVREGKKTPAYLYEYKNKLEKERNLLCSKFKELWMFLNEEESVLDTDIPELKVKEAGKHYYVSGIQPEAFSFLDEFQMHTIYADKRPDENYLQLGVTMLQLLINELTWAIGEVNAHIKKAEENIKATPYIKD